MTSCMLNRNFLCADMDSSQQQALFARRPSTGTERRSPSANEHISRRDSLRVRRQMSSRVWKYLPVLKHINKLADRANRDFVRKCDRGFLDCIKNALKGNVLLTNRQKTKLRRSRKYLIALSVKKTALRKKRRILQKALLPPILGVLNNLLLQK